ncbi:magnesium transporter CorA family protein [Frankia sp. R82]|uniref:magnesium transporter CorA family protein n=1 Tax=Frankia sp. R82 TaxID=2950553 RepID=UPI0020437F1F|nr:magnesium transporter CorA family protein [Frankia sp. R82]MCM3883193.1 magnesium transporter CorA family protein [Frankia sp. R82]
MTRQATRGERYGAVQRCDSPADGGGPDGGGPAAAVRTRAWRAGVVVEEDFPLAELHRYREQEDVVVWVDLCAPRSDEVRLVAKELQLDAHAVEDALAAGERPKFDRYPSHLFLNTYAVRIDVASGELTSHEISAFIAGRTLVTVRPDDGFDLAAVTRRWDGETLAAHGVGHLVHGLVDEVVDGYLAAAQTLDDASEDLEDMLFDEQTPEQAVHRRSFELRKSLVLLRRRVVPMRDALTRLMRPDVGLVTDGLVASYQDVYDHILRVMEWADSLRDLITSVLDTNLTIQSNRLNLVMKKLTGWAAVIAVPTLVTGFFGQNVPFPGNGEHWGFEIDLGLLVISMTALFVIFRRRGWL